MRALGLLLGGALVGCGAPTTLQTQRSPADALSAARAALTTRGYALDATPHDPVRTSWRCLTQRDPRQGGIDWAASFAREALGPLPFETVGPATDDDVPADRCALIFRVAVTADPSPKGSTLRVDQAWYRATRGACTPEGNPLLGEVRCAWRYVGAQPTGDATRPIRLALRDL